MNEPRSWFDAGKMYIMFLHIAVIALGFEVILLVVQNRELKGGGQLAEHLQRGDFFSFADLTLVGGDSSGFSDSSVSLLYIFSTKCAYCKKNLGPWAKIYQAAKSQGFLVFGICVDTGDSAAAFMANNVFEYPVFAARNGRKYSQMNKIVGVPQTVLRSAFGKVEEVWPAVLSDSTSAEIVKAMSNLQSRKKS
jgi:peroxiredoxin